MTEEQFKNLKRGDIVRHASTKGSSYVVTAVYGSRVTAVDTIDLTNPPEWELVQSLPPVGAIKDRIRNIVANVSALEGML